MALLGVAKSDVLDVYSQSDSESDSESERPESTDRPTGQHQQSLDRPTEHRHVTRIVPVRIGPTEVDRGRQRIDSCQPTEARQGPDRGPTEGPTELDRARQTDSQGSGPFRLARGRAKHMRPCAGLSKLPRKDREKKPLSRQDSESKARAKARQG